MLMKSKAKKGLVVAVSMLAFSSLLLGGCQTQGQSAVKDGAGAGAGNATTLKNGSIVILNYNAVMENHPKMSEAQNKMRSEYDKVRQEMKDNESLPQEERQAKIMEAQANLEKLGRDTIEPLQKEVNDAIDKVMEEKGASAVVDRKAVLRGGEDITKDVLVKLGVKEAEAQKIAETGANTPSMR